MRLARCINNMCWLLIFLLPHRARLADAGRCQGTADLEALGSQFCENFINETSCNDGYDSFCRWDMESSGCIVVAPTSSSCCELMVDSAEDCSTIEGCYWVEIPVWVWLAINVPLWLLIGGVCLICYYKQVGNSRIQVFDREESITISSDSSQVTEEQEQTQDTFDNPIPPAVHSKAISESEPSSNEKSVFEMEDGAVILLEKGMCDDN